MLALNLDDTTAASAFSFSYTAALLSPTPLVVPHT
jgi:hypothetical protein